MRLLYILSGIVVLSFLLWYKIVNNEINLLQYRAVRVGCTRLFQLVDSLFNAFSSEEDNKIDSMFDSVDHTRENEEEIAIDRLTCYSWSSLNEIININRDRVMNASTIVSENQYKLFDKLQIDLQITSAIVKNYNKRLNVKNTRQYLTVHQSQISDILATINSINTGFQYIIGDAIEKIDHDQLNSYECSSARLVKIIEQFEKIIQSRNEVHLGCTCDVAKLLDGVVKNFMESVHSCVDVIGESFSNYIKETILSMANSMESLIRSFNTATKRSKTSVEVLYQLPKKVCFLYVLIYSW